MITQFKIKQNITIKNIQMNKYNNDLKKNKYY